MTGLYNILFGVGFVLASPVYLYKMVKRGKYRENFWQRFGRYTPELIARLRAKPRPRLWLQAVSVGEINLALLLLPALRRRLPEYDVVVTTTTTTGYALARERLPADVPLLYFPQDFRGPVRRAYDLIQPDAVVLMESELWPNHIGEARRRGLPVFLVNARMSSKSACRHQRFRWPFRHVWPCLKFIAVQSSPDYEHYLAAGVPREKLHLTGNLKYDAALTVTGQRSCDPRAVLAGYGITPTQPVLVAGSTHPGEEEILFDVVIQLRQQFPDLFFVLVPRHVERAAELVELAKRKRVQMALRKGGGAAHPDCLLVNTTGELRSFYEVATVIFVGKSLCGIGGQNIVEAAATGHPVVCGPHMENFREITQQFVAAGAIVQVPDTAALRPALAQLLAEPARRKQLAAAAQKVIQANVGATERTVELLAQALTATSVSR